MFGPNFSGPGKQPRIDLSTSSSTSSTSLLSSVRVERQQRELFRRQELASTIIQKTWRGRHEALKVRLSLLRDLEEGNWSWEKRGRALIVLTGNTWKFDDGEIGKRAGKVIEKWCVEGKEVDLITQVAKVFESLNSTDFIDVLGILLMRFLDLVMVDPRTTQTANVLAFIESIFVPTSFEHFGEKASELKVAIVNALGASWVDQLVHILENLVASSLPKKKHPNLQPVTRLLTASFNLVPSTQNSPFLPQLLQTLLTVPSLPSVLPLPSLTHLSTHLPLFSALLPLASSKPELLSQGRLSTELGKTYLLANLVTFGITGGMLARYGIKGASDWIRILGVLLEGVQEGWGRWTEGHVEEVEEVHPKGSERDGDGEDEDEDETMPLVAYPQPPTSKRQTPVRAPLQPTIGSRLLVLASANHMSSLSSFLTSPSSKAPTSLLFDFAKFVLALLKAFRGSPKWELILDSLLEGKTGRILSRRMIREGIRGRWRNSSQLYGWDTFSENPSTPCLLFLTHLYNHYLLLTPDDEFFSQDLSNPLTFDEISVLAGIWRDLAFWGYMNGVNEVSNPHPTSGRGTEDDRSLLTRGITRLAERNARRKFTEDNFWVMASQINLDDFIEAAVFADSELLRMNGEEGTDPEELPRWARNQLRLTRRQMAYISPVLGLLNNLPMTVPFQTRAQVFRQFVNADRHRLRIARYDGRRGIHHNATIHRDSLAEDGFRQLNDRGPGLKGTVHITFIDQFGFEESGIDGGGLFKEFFTSLSKEVFDTNRGLWLATDQNELYPNPHSYATESHQLSWYGFIGRVLGKALYEGILIDVSFAGFFLAKWLDRQSYLDDLRSLDKELYKGLIMLKNYPKPEELSLNFTITEEEFGQVRSIDLLPNGADIPVTSENRHEYIQLVCKYKLNHQISAQSRAFFNGLSDIIDPKWLRMFDQQELQQLIGGEETPIDLNDLKAHAVVSGFPNDITMRLFWKVVKGFTQNERRALLLFATSCSRPPLLGFAHLNPQFGIRCSGTDTTRLPSASTCANLLKMPSYTDEEMLRTKLLQAITSGSGFDMS